jgi:2-polyprenyl-3-methyl-5-hydroxy-6-metoxy-1,4-benzoquinol methylase
VTVPITGPSEQRDRQSREEDKAFERDWDSYSDLVDARKEAPEWEVLRQARLTHWQELFRIEPGQRILDAGCGHGDYSVLARKAGARVWAFDLSPRMVENTRRRLIRNELEVEALTVGSVTSINYPDENFDVVMCLGVIAHVPDYARQQAVNELARVLRHAGLLYISTPNLLAYHWRGALWLMRQLGLLSKAKIRFHRPGQLGRLVRTAGLLPGRSLGLEFVPPFSGIAAGFSNRSATTSSLRPKSPDDGQSRSRFDLSVIAVFLHS